MVIACKDLTEFQELMEKSKEKLVVVDFWAEWCGPCRMIAPIIDEMAVEYPDAIFVKVDVDKASDISSLCGVSNLPTLQFFKGGEKVDKTVGFRQKSQLKELIKKHL